ncbi:MAG: glycosyltransferase family 1 protein [Bacteroidota bacterium]|nr:glycosyltransferase family 1 protein [Bacteroidota bacterium]
MEYELVIDARLLYGSGIGTYLRNLIIPISEKYHTKILTNSKSLERYPIFKNLDFEILNSSIYSIREQFELFNKIPKCKLFWSPHYNVPLLPINAKKKLVTIHDVFHLAYFHELSLSQKIYSKVLIQLASTVSNKIITVSNFSKREIIKHTGVKSNKIEVIYNGIDFCEIQAITIRVPKKYFLFVGNLKPHKNIKILLEAFSKFTLQNTEYKLVIVGKKEGLKTVDRESLTIIEQDKTKNNIIFLENISDEELVYIYKNAVASVFPSLYEGFGYPPLESIVQNTPCICSDIEVLHEVYGESVIYFNPTDSNALNEKLQNVINEHHFLTKESKEKIISKYSLDNFVKCHIELIEKLL